uniref:Uncharacterized protein n=1 Tax=Helianthus annuus TaxID=4232 RepID=A0A251V7Z1_HELAN
MGIFRVPLRLSVLTLQHWRERHLSSRLSTGRLSSINSSHCSTSNFSRFRAPLRLSTGM